MWGDEMHVFSKSRRVRLREIAREEYYVASKIVGDPEKNPSAVRRLAVGNARSRLAQTNEYGGFLNALLLSIAIKVITKLIEHWIEKHLSASDVPQSYQEGEPGYV